MRPVNRRLVLGAAGGLLAACSQAPQAQPPEVRAAPAIAPETEPVAAAAPPEPAPAPAVVEPAPPAPPPAPSLVDLGVDGVVQPVWSGDGGRVLFFDQPGRGQGGTWSVDLATGQVALERPQWGYYVAQGTLLATPRPAQRDTYVLHLPSGREWALPTSNSTLFSWDGTMVAYGAAAPTAGAFGGPGNFQPTTLVVSWADGQEARRLPLPISASLVAWLPGPDGSPNGRILLTGKRNRADTTGI